MQLPIVFHPGTANDQMNTFLCQQEHISCHQCIFEQLNHCLSLHHRLHLLLTCDLFEDLIQSWWEGIYTLNCSSNEVILWMTVTATTSLQHFALNSIFTYCMTKWTFSLFDKFTFHSIPIFFASSADGFADGFDRFELVLKCDGGWKNPSFSCLSGGQLAPFLHGGWKNLQSPVLTWRHLTPLLHFVLSSHCSKRTFLSLNCSVLFTPMDMPLHHHVSTNIDRLFILLWYHINNAGILSLWYIFSLLPMSIHYKSLVLAKNSPSIHIHIDFNLDPEWEHPFWCVYPFKLWNNNNNWSIAS